MRIAILYGGPSSEHEVSLSSAKNVMAALDRTQHEIEGVFIDKEGRFHIDTQEPGAEDAIAMLKRRADVVFPVLHGAFGEDGTLQALLEQARMRFVGSGSAASRLAMDKVAAGALFASVGLLVPWAQLLTAQEALPDLRFPIIVKPVAGGSSIGLSRFERQEDYRANGPAVAESEPLMAQELVTGREFTCGVIERAGREEALPVTEIVLDRDNLFDYEAKYVAGKCREITPADIDDTLRLRIQETAVRCHKALGCRSLSRTDMIVSASGEIYVLETNTLPGMTATSFMPAQAGAAGISMPELMSLLMDSAHL